MSAQPINVTGLEVIEHLDFKAELPCEHSRHKGAQSAIFAIHLNPHCGSGRQFLVCLGCWERVGVIGLFCTKCGADRNRDDAWTIIRVIGSQS